jgi:hypothetical protein
MYFYPNIDSLFLREYTLDICFHQSRSFLRQLPDKVHVQRIELNQNPLMNKFQVVDFPNLKKVTLVKRVSPQPQNWNAMREKKMHNFPLYLQSNWDESNAKAGRTHFLSGIELIQLGAMWTPSEHKFVEQHPRETQLFRKLLEDVKEGGTRRSLEYDFKGAIYDRIPEQSKWYNMGNKAEEMAETSSETIADSRIMLAHAISISFPLWGPVGR